MGLLRIVILTLSASVICSPPAWSWGLDGHRAIGMITDLILKSDPAGAAATQLLGGHSLSEASLWADCAKAYCHRPLSVDERTFVDNNPQHKGYHYTDVAIQQPQYTLGTAGTRDDDVVRVSKQAINILRGRPPNQGPAVLEKKSALWVLAHMIGDIHQPLHVGAVYYDQDCKEVVDPNVVGAGKPNFGIGSTVVSTRGGNGLKLPNGKSFHLYWDNGTVTGAMRLAGVKKKSIEGLRHVCRRASSHRMGDFGRRRNLAGAMGYGGHAARECCAEPIKIGDATHAARGCTWPVTLDRDYTLWANQQTLVQLGKAGFRLAAVLRAVSP